MTHTGAADRTRLYLFCVLDAARDEACSRVMNALAPDCAPLCWSVADRARSRMNGLASTRAYSDAAAAAVVQAWARQFELQPHPNPTPGTIRYDGEIHGLEVKVWAITDTDTFQAAVRRMVAR